MQLQQRSSDLQKEINASKSGIVSSLTVEKAATGITLHNLAKNNSAVIKATLMKLLLDASSLFKSKCSDFAIGLLAEMLLEKCPYETLEDICLAVRKGCKGDFGTNYKSFDADTLWRWIECYLELKAQYREQVNTENKKLLTDDAPTELTDESRKVLKKIKQRISENQQAKKERQRKEQQQEKDDLESERFKQQEALRVAFEVNEFYKKENHVQRSKKIKKP